MVAPLNTNRDAVFVTQYEVECSNEPTKLFELIEESDWDKVVAFCTEFPTEAHKWGVRRDKDRKVGWRRLPLHEACIRQANLEVIEVLLKAFPEAIQAKDHNGRLALHHACFHGASREVIRKLMLAYPGSLHVKDVWGKTPLSVAQGSSAANKVEIIEDVGKGVYYWVAKIEEEKWLVEREEKISSLNKMFQEERDEYESRLTKIAKRAADDKDHLGKLVKSLQDGNVSLNEKLTVKTNQEELLQTKVKELNRAALNSANEKIELDKKLASLTSKLNRVEGELKGSLESNTSLSNELNGLKRKLDHSSKTIYELQDKVEVAQNKSFSLEQELRVTKKSELVLKAKVTDLGAELSKANTTLTDSNIIHKKEMKESRKEISLLRNERSALAEEKALLEEKVEDDRKTIATIGKSSADYYLQSTRRIAEIEQKVVELETTILSKNNAHAEEIGLLKTEITNLQKSLFAAIKSRSEESQQTLETIAVVQSALTAASAEHERMAGALEKHKQSFEAKKENDLDAIPSEKRSEKDAIKNERPKLRSFDHSESEEEWVARALKEQARAVKEQEDRDKAKEAEPNAEVSQVP